MNTKNQNLLSIGLKLALILILSATAFMVTLTHDAQTATATTVMALDDAEYVAYSDYILHGYVEKTATEQLPNGLIVTRVTLKVIEWFKTPENWTTLPETMDFYTRGGQQGEFVQHVSGEFNAQIGDELVVLLEKIPRYDMRPMLVGLSSGAFAIDNTPVTNTDGKRKLLQRQEREKLNIYRRQSPKSNDIQSAKDLESLRSAIIRQVKLEKDQKLSIQD